MRTATITPFLRMLGFLELLPSLLLPFFFAFLGSFLGAFAVAGADLGLEEFGAGGKGARLAHAGDHLDAVPDAHLGHLPHDGAHLIELPQEFLDVGRVAAAAHGDAATAADVDDVWV